MNTKWLDPKWKPAHPVRDFWLMAVALVALSTPFAFAAHYYGRADGGPGLDAMKIAAVALGIPLLGTGTCLLPFQFRRPLLYAGWAVAILCPATAFLMCLIAPRIPIGKAWMVIWPIFSATCAVLAAWLGIAGYGWYLYLFRPQPSAAKPE